MLDVDSIILHLAGIGSWFFVLRKRKKKQERKRKKKSFVHPCFLCFFFSFMVNKDLNLFNLKANQKPSQAKPNRIYLV